MNITFEKDGSQWFAVIPEWGGSRADLEMVCNADLMCDILAQGEDIVHTQLSLTEPKFYKAKLTRVELTPKTGGAFYMCNWNKQYNLDSFQIWLCEVTEFVFGSMPETIYVS